MTKISVIIVTYNSSALIADCLQSLYDNNDIGDGLEVIVVDNASADVEVLRELIVTRFQNVLLLENTRNGGYGQGNNMGIVRASSPIIMIMNPDVRLFYPIFQKAVKRFEDADLDLLGMKQYETPIVAGSSFHPIGSSVSSLLMYRAMSRFDIYSSRLFFISGACFFVRKQSFERVGLFDEDIFLYGEETDINIRLLKNNPHAIKYDKTMGYIHPVHVRRVSFETMKRSYFSLLHIYEKNMFDKEKMRKDNIFYYKLLRFRAKKKKDEFSTAEYDKMIAFLEQAR